MEERLKHRLVGAAVIVSLVVIFVPMMLDSGDGEGANSLTTNIPPKPAEGFSSRIVPLDEPKTPLLDERDAREKAAAQRDRQASNPGAPDSPDPPRRAAVEPPATSPEAGPPEPEIPQPPEGVTAWAVQLGSFSNAQNAMALRDRLRSKGYSAFVESAYSERGAVTRVFVGPELALGKAKEAVDKLHSETKLRGIVVKYPGG